MTCRTKNFPAQLFYRIFSRILITTATNYACEVSANSFGTHTYTICYVSPNSFLEAIQVAEEEKRTVASSITFVCLVMYSARFLSYAAHLSGNIFLLTFQARVCFFFLFFHSLSLAGEGTTGSLVLLLDLPEAIFFCCLFFCSC